MSRKQVIGFELRELFGDLFTSSDQALAHCVSHDLRMGAGIALQFRNRFGQVDTLYKHLPQTCPTIVYLPPSQMDQRYAFYLVTKYRYYDKPTYDDLLATLSMLRRKLDYLGITTLSIPVLGCGLDKLKWPLVRDLICSVFENSGIRISVYTFKHQQQPNYHRQNYPMITNYYQSQGQSQSEQRPRQNYDQRKNNYVQTQSVRSERSSSPRQDRRSYQEWQPRRQPIVNYETKKRTLERNDNDYCYYQPKIRKYYQEKEDHHSKQNRTKIEEDDEDDFDYEDGEVNVTTTNYSKEEEDVIEEEKEDDLVISFSSDKFGNKKVSM